MTDKPLQKIFGLSGVTADEREIARRWGHRFEIPMLLLALWILIEWYAESNNALPPGLSKFTDWFIWLFFILETSVLAMLVKDKRRFLSGNWVNLLIIILGTPILWGGGNYAGALRSLRLLLMLSLILNISDSVREVLSRNNLGITLLVAFIFIIFSGIFIAGIDPAIDSLWDGIWWSWVTVTTVGYGDIVPSSAAGKIFGAILILLGIGLFSLLTANFSAFFINKEEKALLKEGEQEFMDVIRNMEARLLAIEEKVGQIHAHVHDTPGMAVNQGSKERQPSDPE